MRLTTSWIFLAAVVYRTSAIVQGGLRGQGSLTNEPGSILVPESGPLPSRRLEHHKYEYPSEAKVEKEMEKAAGSKKHHKEEDGMMAEHMAKAHKKETEKKHPSKSKSSKSSKSSTGKQKGHKMPMYDYDMSMSMPIKAKSTKKTPKDHEMP